MGDLAKKNTIMIYLITITIHNLNCYPCPNVLMPCKLARLEKAH